MRKKPEPVVRIYPSPRVIEALKGEDPEHWRAHAREIVGGYLEARAAGQLVATLDAGMMEGRPVADQVRVVVAMESAGKEEAARLLSERMLDRAREIAATDPDVLRQALEELATASAEPSYRASDSEIEALDFDDGASGA